MLYIFKKNLISYIFLGLKDGDLFPSVQYSLFQTHLNANLEQHCNFRIKVNLERMFTRRISTI